MRVKINGTEYKGLSNWRVSEKVGNPTSTTLSVLVESQPIPRAGDVIELLTDGMRDNFFGDISESIFFKYLAKQ